MEIKKYLPIGSVVKVKKENQLLMIMGYLIKQGDTVYDYSCCVYPEGVLSLNELLVINHDKIEDIYFQGYKPKGYEEFSELLEKINNIGDKNE